MQRVISDNTKRASVRPMFQLRPIWQTHTEDILVQEQKVRSRIKQVNRRNCPNQTNPAERSRSPTHVTGMGLVSAGQHAARRHAAFCDGWVVACGAGLRGKAIGESEH